ncbi:MAG: hypothetical protein AVDCRST_MAG27-2852, partial [uncultured Craurococcus sp.]
VDAWTDSMVSTIQPQRSEDDHASINRRFSPRLALVYTL